VAVSIACLRAAQEIGGKNLPAPSFMAGHSLGEYTALAAANVLDFSTTVFLAKERGRLMYEAGMKTPGSMMAIIGLDEAILAEVCKETNTVDCQYQQSRTAGHQRRDGKHRQSRGNGQSQRAARALPLQVSGAFHSPLMQPAVDGMTQILAKVTFKDPIVPIIANVTAQPLTSGSQIREELLKQLCSSVQWQRSVEYMVGQGVGKFIEIGPAESACRADQRISRESEMGTSGMRTL